MEVKGISEFKSQFTVRIRHIAQVCINTIFFFFLSNLYAFILSLLCHFAYVFLIPPW